MATTKTKRNLLPIDELNKFSERLVNSEYTDENGVTHFLLDKEDIIDEMLDLYLLAIANGEIGTNVSLDTDVTLSGDKVNEIVNKKVAGKTWKDRVSEYVDNGGSSAEIIRVADTEMVRDFNAAGYETAKSSGVNCKKRWVTMMDEKVRDTHDYIEGLKVGLDEKFYTFDGDSALYPGNFALPENNINCRCQIEYVKE